MAVGSGELDTTDMEFILISGSMSPKPHTLALVEAFAEGLDAHGATGAVVDVRSPQLPPIETKHHRDPLAHPDPLVSDLAARAVAADGFVIASPVYHNSYSGELKRLLDHLHTGAFEGKPVVLAGNGGRTRSTQAVDHLRQVVRGLRAIALPDQVVTQNGDFEDGGDHWVLTYGPILERVDRAAASVVDVARRLAD